MSWQKGVEEWCHYQFLEEIGCDQIQGYLISRLLPNQNIRRFLQEWRFDAL